MKSEDVSVRFYKCDVYHSSNFDRYRSISLYIGNSVGIDGTYYIDNDSFTWFYNRSYTVMHDLPVLYDSTLSAEDLEAALFQQSLLWNHELDFDLAVQLQKYAVPLLLDVYELYSSFNASRHSTVTIQY